MADRPRVEDIAMMMMAAAGEPLGEAVRVVERERLLPGPYGMPAAVPRPEVAE